MKSIKDLKIERVLETCDSFEEAEERDRAYWRSRTPEERMEALEVMRRIFYGEDRCTGRIERVLETLD